jgi:hypothetical protein
MLARLRAGPRRLRLLVAGGLTLLLALAVAVAAGVIVGSRGGGAHVEETTTPTVPHHPPPAQPPPPAPHPAPHVSHRAKVKNGAMVVDNRPFFPIMSWGECIDGFETSLPVGTNLYAADRCGGLEAQVPALDGHALSAAVAGEAVPPGGDVIGVFYPDEPDAKDMTGSTLPEIDPGSGIRFLTLSNHFYSGAAALSYGRGIYPGLIAKADVVGFDLYPLQVWCRPDRLVDVYLAQQELVRLAAGKPTFQWIEAAGMGDCAHGATAVTPDTVRAESWLAVAGGARGLGFFPPAAWTGDVGEAIADVTGRIRQLGPALLAPDAAVAAESDNGLVRAGARSYRDRIYVIAINAGFGPATATISAPGLEGRPLTVMGAGRTVTPSGDSFTERFPALGARVYVAGPSGGS